MTKKQAAANASKLAANYPSFRAEAQRKANETGFDYGLEANSLFGDYMIYMLPRRENRSGHELRCEVVSCETLSKCQPGHGPTAVR